MMQTLRVGFFRKFYRFGSWLSWRGKTPAVVHSVRQLPTEAGNLGSRVYAQADGADKPLIVYFHGGGWVIGDLQTHHPFCQAFSHHTGCTLISIDYRLAPEHTFPAAHNDCLAAAKWIAEHINELGPANGKMVLAGDSAGANLAVCSALSLDPAVASKVAGEILIYPVTDHYSVPYASYEECATGQALTRDVMHWFWDTYLGATAPESDEVALARPIHASNLSSLPPTLLITAERDPLRDEGRQFAQKCEDAGVTVDYKHYEDVEHGFACSEGPTPQFQAFIDQTRDWLRTL